jgi:arsenate reductase
LLCDKLLFVAFRAEAHDQVQSFVSVLHECLPHPNGGSAFTRSGRRFDVFSGGAETGPLDPDAIQAMRELEIDISGQSAKDISDFFGQRFNYVISLCDRQQERSCPIFPGAIFRIQWEVENPALADDHPAAVRRARDQLRQHIVRFVSENQ